MSDEKRVLSSARLLAAALIAIAAGMVSLFVHDFALTRLGVPYPAEAPLPQDARVAEMLLVVSGLVAFARLSQLRLSVLSPLVAAMAGAALIAMLLESLRVIVITTTLAQNGWSHGYFLFALARFGPEIAVEALLAAVAVLIAPRMPRLRDLIAMTVGLTLLASFLLRPAAHDLAAWACGRLAGLDADNRYAPPYPFGVYTVIYATYIEPTLASFAMAGLVWPALRGGLLRRSAVFCGLLLLIHGRIGQFAIGSFWVENPSLPLRFAATGQFLFETMVLGIACPLIWALAVERRNLD